jgi:putative transposase
MPDYRRFRVPAGTCFLTTNLLAGRSDPLVGHIDARREALRRTQRERPYRVGA